MSRSSRRRSSGRATPERYSLLRELDLDVSWPVAFLTLFVLLLGFGPLLLVALFDTQGLGRNVLVAAGPVLVCLAFAVMTYVFGLRSGMSRGHVWSLVLLFVVLGVLAGWGAICERVTGQ